MTASIFACLFLIALACAHLTKYGLAQRQIRYVLQHRSAVPSQFRKRISLTAHQGAADYTVANTRLNQFDIVIQTAVILGLTLFGGIHFLNQTLLHWFSNPYIQQIALIVAVLVLTSLIDLPLQYYRQFVTEARFGFNKMTPSLFFSDLLKNTLVSLVIGLPFLFLVLWVMHQTGKYWYFWTWLAWVGFQMLMIVIYPNFIAPIFNKFEPLQDESLQNRIRALMQKCGFKAKGLFVMDGSRRSAHGNAYFTGFGSSKRIVFFDTLLNKLSPPQIEAVLAHELGHFKHRHVLKRMITIFVISLLLLALLGYVAQQSWFYQGLGVQAMPTPGLALILFVVVLPTFFFFITPFSNMHSRQHEFEADDFAKQQTNAQDLIDALLTLYEDNASTLTTDPIYSAFYYSHPPASQRIAHLQRQQ